MDAQLCTGWVACSQARRFSCRFMTPKESLQILFQPNPTGSHRSLFKFLDVIICVYYMSIILTPFKGCLAVLGLEVYFTPRSGSGTTWSFLSGPARAWTWNEHLRREIKMTFYSWSPANLTGPWEDLQRQQKVPRTMCATLTENSLPKVLQPTKLEIWILMSIWYYDLL